MKKTAIMLLAAALIFSASPALAQYECNNELNVVADLAVVRPLGLAATILGTAAFIVSLPFSIPSSSVGKTAKILVANPFTYTFSRPVGEFGNQCGQAQSGQPSTLPPAQPSVQPPGQAPAPPAGPRNP